jgi:arylformamidase
MEIIDISRNLQEAPLYPGSPKPLIEKVLDVQKGDAYSVSKYVFTSHLGTHADAFSHFIAGGLDIERMPLEHYYGQAQVIRVLPKKILAREDFDGRIEQDIERIVLHGGGESYLSKEAADYLISRKIKTIVTDAWSVGPLDNEIQIHKTLFAANIAVIENVNLEAVTEGRYILSAFPVKIKGLDGALVRAVLIRN